MRVSKIVSAGVILIAALPALVYTIDPPGRDQGVFGYIGWRWIHGGVPYLDAGMEHKGPLPFLAYALVALLFREPLTGARWLGWIALVVAGWGVSRLARRVLESAENPREPYATLAGVTYVLITGLGGLSTWWSGAQAETFMEPFVVWALVAAVADPGTRRPWLSAAVAGAFLGVASLGKPTVLLLAPVLLLALTGRENLSAIAGRLETPGSRILPKFGGLLAGLLLPWTGTLLWFAAHGGVTALVESVFLANLDYGRKGLALIPARLSQFLASHHTFVDLRFLAPASVGAFLLSRQRSAAARMAIGWAVASYVLVLIQGRYFGYHFFPVVGPVALLACVGAASLWPAARHSTFPRRIAAILVLLVGSMGVLGFDRDAWSLRWRRITGEIPEFSFLTAVAPAGDRRDVDPWDTLRAARWANDRLSPSETLLVWGFEPAVNVLARRRCPTRFIYDYFLTSKNVPEARRARYWGMFWADVEKEPPDWIAVVHNDVNPLEREDSAAQLAREPRLSKWLDERYEPEALVGDFEFYRRRP